MNTFSSALCHKILSSFSLSRSHCTPAQSLAMIPSCNHWSLLETRGVANGLRCLPSDNVALDGPLSMAGRSVLIRRAFCTAGGLWNGREWDKLTCWGSTLGRRRAVYPSLPSHSSQTGGIANYATLHDVRSMASQSTTKATYWGTVSRVLYPLRLYAKTNEAPMIDNGICTVFTIITCFQKHKKVC